MIHWATIKYMPGSICESFNTRHAAIRRNADFPNKFASAPTKHPGKNKAIVIALTTCSCCGHLGAHECEDVVEAGDAADDVLGQFLADDGLDGGDHVDGVEGVEADLVERAREVDLPGRDFDGFGEPVEDFGFGGFVVLHFRTLVATSLGPL